MKNLPYNGFIVINSTANNFDEREKHLYEAETVTVACSR